MNPPLIAVSTSVTVGEYPERAYVNAAYLKAIQAAGGVPVPMPPLLDAPARAEILKRVHGVLLTGGGDVAPARFGETPHPTTSLVSDARDSLEIDLTHWAVDTRVPLLAVCRGLQVLNVALGGSIYQDIPSEPGSPIDHSQSGKPRHIPVHRVKVRDGSRLAEILGTVEVDVNSFHHQAIRRLASGLHQTARGEDGTVEGVESDDGLIVAVQCHPEELSTDLPWARRLFERFVARARSRSTTRR